MLLSNPTPPQKVVRQLTPTTPPNHWFSDARKHGYDGSTRNVRMARVVVDGGGSISNSPDGLKCAVAGTGSRWIPFQLPGYPESLTRGTALRILRFSDVNPGQPGPDHHKATVGRGGHRIDASRNMWEGSGLKLDSASTDVVWGNGSRFVVNYCPKISLDSCPRSFRQQDTDQRSKRGAHHVGLEQEWA